IQSLNSSSVPTRRSSDLIVEIVSATREHPSVYLGASPRSSIALMKAAKAYAFIHGRDYVTPDEVKYLAPYVLSHRIILNSQAKFEGLTREKLVQDVIQDSNVPIRKESYS